MSNITKRRSKLDIMIKVLSTISDGEHKPTKIRYAANMSWNLTQRVFEDLVEQELISLEELPGAKRSTKRYDLTEKGQKVLEYFEGAKTLLNV